MSRTHTPNNNPNPSNPNIGTMSKTTVAKVRKGSTVATGEEVKVHHKLNSIRPKMAWGYQAGIITIADNEFIIACGCRLLIYNSTVRHLGSAFGPDIYYIILYYILCIISHV